MKIDDVVKEMHSGRHGGFAAALAEAWYVADGGNRWKIETNWAILFHKLWKLLEAEAVGKQPTVGEAAL